MLRSAAASARRGIATVSPHYGALCYDHTFTRVLGTKGASEPILEDLIGALMRGGGSGHSAPPVAVKIVDRRVLGGNPPMGKGELLVDVRAEGGEEGFLVEVQHRVEPLFPRRALLYTAAELVMQHKSGLLGAALRPVHTLAFCDFDFSRGQAGLATTRSLWRRAAVHEPQPSRAVTSFALLPRADYLEGLKQHANEALAADMAARLTLTFALLPHAPRLHELTPATPPLLRWAALVAHVGPRNLHEVPKDVRSKGVEALLELLKDTMDETERERGEAEEQEDKDLRVVEAMLAEAKVALMEASKAEGKAEGKAELLHQLGIGSTAELAALLGRQLPTAA